MKRYLSFLLMLVLVLFSVGAFAEELSLTDQMNAISVYYISDRDFFYYEKEDSYVLRFSLKDKDKEYLTSPTNVRFSIQNNKGEVIYKDERKITQNDYYEWSSALYSKKTMATIFINPDLLPKSENKNGTVTLNVWLDGYFEFEEYTINIDDLPTTPLEEKYSLELPELPVEVERILWDDDILSKARITEVKYSFEESYSDKVDLVLYITGEKTYDYKGDKNNDACMIAWKLYDSEGYVVETGTAFTQSVAVGEFFRDCKERIYDLKPGAYRLELTDSD